MLDLPRAEERAHDHHGDAIGDRHADQRRWSDREVARNVTTRRE
jgi:hypothetical protein